MIEVKSVTKTYGKKHNSFIALDDINLRIPDGTTVAIIGKSGSGKSTLMHAMSGLDRPEKGEVVIDGVDILKMKARKIDRFRSEKIGFIFQSFFVQANESCHDNVSLPLEIARVKKSDRKQLINDALAAVELSEKAGAKARNLSGGQKQRLAIARAIVNKPRIIFADEPTGNLDSATSDRIEDLLFDLNTSTGSILVIVTHDRELANKCDMRIHIKDGKVEKIEQKKGAAK